MIGIQNHNKTANSPSFGMAFPVLGRENTVRKFAEKTRFLKVLLPPEPDNKFLSYPGRFLTIVSSRLRKIPFIGKKLGDMHEKHMAGKIFHGRNGLLAYRWVPEEELNGRINKTSTKPIINA